MESWSYKGYLKGGDGENVEVRRFLVEKEPSSTTTFDRLKKKLEEVFPSLQGKNFRVTWQDEDNDLVTIATDEELKIALTEMTGPIYKVNIEIVAQRAEIGAAAAAEKLAKQGEVHPGVVCDGCDGEVRGHRYKCMVCLDYDLCAECEVKGIHPGHNMMRLTSVQIWPNNFFKRLQKMQERVAKRQMCRDKGEVEEDTEANNSAPGAGGAAPRATRRGRCGLARGRGLGCFAPGRPSGALDAMLQGWMGTGTGPADSAEAAHKQACQKASEEHKAMHEAAHKAATAKTATANSNDTAAYLKTVGNAVAAALDPFGVDVDISIEEPTTVKTTATTTSTTEAKKVAETECPEDTDSSDCEPYVEVIEPQGTNKEKSGASSVAGNDEKKIVDEAMVAPSNSQRSSVSPASKTDDGDWCVFPQQQNDSLYPDLPSQPDASIAAPNTNTLKPKDQKIEVALQAMMNMGFSNEGGWLTSLLEAKQGDIGKVLDVLQPVRK